MDNEGKTVSQDTQSFLEAEFFAHQRKLAGATGDSLSGPTERPPMAKSTAPQTKNNLNDGGTHEVQSES